MSGIKNKKQNSRAFQTLVESFWMSVDDVYHPTTPPYAMLPRPLHHVRAGQPLPKIVYEEDESLLYAVYLQLYNEESAVPQTKTCRVSQFHTAY